jgi:hypothetical protein
VKLLAKLGLAFRSHGESESYNCKSCKRSFSASLKYLAKFDGFLKHHLEIYEFCGTTVYSPLKFTNNFFLSWLMISKKKKKNFTVEMENSKNFSVIADSVLDARLSRMDLLT